MDWQTGPLQYAIFIRLNLLSNIFKDLNFLKLECIGLSRFHIESELRVESGNDYVLNGWSGID